MSKIVLVEKSSKVDDEGYLKICSKIGRFFKEHGSFVINCKGLETPDTNVAFRVNRFFLSKKLKRYCYRQNVLYICQGPSFGKTIKLIALFLYLKCKKVTIAFAQTNKLPFCSRVILGLFKPYVIVFSSLSLGFFEKISKKVYLCKTGVDTSLFVPVKKEEKEKLRKKLNFATNKPVILHVGHLKKGRNIELFASLDGFTKVLIVSTSTEADPAIKDILKNAKDLFLINQYVDNLEVYYQASDCYVFLVDNHSNCIDIPLSILEACSCNLPVVTTPFADMTFCENDGFIVLDNLVKHNIEKAIFNAVEANADNRKVALEYDWVDSFIKLDEYLNS